MRVIRALRVPLLALSVVLLLGSVGLAQEDIGFREAEEYDTKGQPFEDATVKELIVSLEKLLGRPEVQEDFSKESRVHFWRFTNRLAKGLLTTEQDAMIFAYLAALAERYPDHADLIARQRFMVEHLMIGKEAPDIVGKDMDGEGLKLSDYRGKVVVLVFTGHWCGPCRGEYPYQRLLLEIMEGEPFALLGVNSDESIEIAKAAKKEERLEYRAWWDVNEELHPGGPIATEWNVVGWPTIYIIDEQGIIRHRDPRMEMMITAVKDLVQELKWREPPR